MISSLKKSRNYARHQISIVYLLHNCTTGILFVSLQILKAFSQKTIATFSFTKKDFASANKLFFASGTNQMIFRFQNMMAHKNHKP